MLTIYDDFKLKNTFGLHSLYKYISTLQGLIVSAGLMLYREKLDAVSKNYIEVSSSLSCSMYILFICPLS